MSSTQRERWRTLLRLKSEDYAMWVAQSHWKYRRNFLWLLRYRGFLASNLYAAFWMLYLTQSLKIPLWIAFDLVTLTFLLSFAAEFPTGYIADRFSRRQSMLVGTVMCMLGLGIAASATHGTYWLVVPGIIIDELGSSLAAGPDDGLANETALALAGKKYTAEELFDRYTDSRVNYTALFRGAGGLVGGLLAVHFGLRSTVWAQVAAYGLAFICAYRVMVPAINEADDDDKQGVGSFWDVTREIIRTRVLVAIILYNGAMLGLTQFSYNFLSIYFSRVRIGSSGLSLGWFGIVWSAFMVSPWVFRRKPIADRFLRRYKTHEYSTLLGLALLAAASTIAAGIWVSIPGLIALFGMYYANAMQQPRMAAKRRNVARREIQSSVASAAQFFVIFVAGLFSLLTGTITKRYSFGAALVSVGVVFGFIAIAGVLLMIDPPASVLLRRTGDATDSTRD